MFSSITPKALFGIGLVASSAIALSANPAQALKITVKENTAFSTVENAQYIDFEDATLRDPSLGAGVGNVSYTDPVSGISYSGIGDFVKNDLRVPKKNGGTRKVAAALPNQAGEYDNKDNTYLTVGSFVQGQKGTLADNLDEEGIVKIALGGASDYFGFYFGSIDTYNHIGFFNDGELVKAISGVDIRAAANGDQGASGARYVDIFAEADQLFDTVVFKSNGIAFETDNHAYRLADPEAVPTPAAVLPILSGLFAVAKRRKQDDSAE